MATSPPKPPGSGGKVGTWPSVCTADESRGLSHSFSSCGVCDILERIDLPFYEGPICVRAEEPRDVTYMCFVSPGRAPGAPAPSTLQCPALAGGSRGMYGGSQTRWGDLKKPVTSNLGLRAGTSFPHWKEPLPIFRVIWGPRYNSFSDTYMEFHSSAGILGALRPSGICLLSLCWPLAVTCQGRWQSLLWPRPLRKRCISGCWRT